MGKKTKKVTPPTLPGELWRGHVDFGHGRTALCAVALPEQDVMCWPYLEFGPHWPTVAQWFVSTPSEGDWISVDTSLEGIVYAACLRALCRSGQQAQTAPEKG